MTGMTQNRKKDSTFGLIAGSVCLAFVLYRYIDSNVLNYLFAIIGSLFIILAVTIPAWLRPFRIFMTVTGHYLGIVNTFMLLTVIFTLVVIPTGYLLRLSGMDRLQRKRLTKVKSYWTDKSEKERSAMKRARNGKPYNHMKNQF